MSTASPRSGASSRYALVWIGPAGSTCNFTGANPRPFPLRATVIHKMTLGLQNPHLPPGPRARQSVPFSMSTLKFAVLAGDYIGPEVMSEALRVLEHVARQEKLTLSYTKADVGGAGIDNH